MLPFSCRGLIRWIVVSYIIGIGSVSKKASDSSCLFFSFISLLQWFLEVSCSLLICFLNYVYFPSPQSLIQYRLSLVILNYMLEVTNDKDLIVLLNYRRFKSASIFLLNYVYFPSQYWWMGKFVFGAPQSQVNEKY